MCQEIRLTDKQRALWDDCNNHDEVVRLDGQLTRLDGAHENLMPESRIPEYRSVHAAEHCRRAKRFELIGDRGAAMIHQLLLANMARAAKQQNKT